MKTKKESIPIQVKKAVGSEYKIDFLGETESGKFYCAYIQNEDTGFPYAIVFKDGKVDTFNGFLALDIISSFQK